MRFYTEAQRLAHPQACLIPSEILNWHFDDTLSELHLALMRTPWESLTPLIAELNGTYPFSKKNYWLCIALSHPGVSDDELMRLAGECGMKITDLFGHAALIGRMNIINQLTTGLAPFDLLNLIKAGTYIAFYRAALGGHLAIMERLIQLVPAELMNMIRADRYGAFRMAAQRGHLAIMERLIALAPTPADVLAMIKADDYRALGNAARGGHLAVMERLMELAPDDVLNMIKPGKYGAFCFAARGGHLATMERLIAIAPTPADVLAMIKADDYDAFRNAAQGGHLAVMERLMELAPAEVLNMIKAENYKVFRDAAFGGHLAIMERLMALAPAEVPNMIKADNYGVFRKAGQGSHLAIMERLMELAPSEVLNMIKANDYEIFLQAAADGHLAIMERLMELAPAETLNMIRGNAYGAFCHTAHRGQLTVMERLIALAPTEVLNMIQANDYDAFRGSACRLPVMERVLALAPADVQNMIKAKNYHAFHWAAKWGHLHIMERLITLAPSEVHNMIKADDYKAFRGAAEEGHIAIMKRLIALAPTEVENMFKADHHQPFRWAALRNDLPTVNWLLSFPAPMAYADIHDHEYSAITHPFINNKLISLRSQRQTLEAANPHAVFDLTDMNEAKCCFYIIRNLIRRNDPTLLDDIRFLLEIPAVKALAHVEVTVRQSNELVRLALTTGNQAAAAVLLTIPAVRDLAARHDYYRAETHGLLDLGALARDRESSMHLLSTGEQERLAAATTRYQPIMEDVGIETLFKEMIDGLVGRYQKNPAKIVIDGKDLVLPADWDEFTHLHLTASQREEALKAYYQHKDHSALRYLSCPNHWMAPDASYVYINEAHTQRWSTFEEYKPLIVMLWLAAQDVTIAPTDGHTLEGRVTHFIDELAHIGRAHNWDHSRNSVNSSGHAIEEEYDDLAGDKPSCFSGVKRRLFQSVIGHPLLKILTEQDIRQELRDFVRGHFTRLITDDNRAALDNALTLYYGSVELSDAAPLRALNISTEQQTDFIQQLTAKYGPQFNKEPIFRSLIEKEFALVEKESNPSDCMHALKFAALVNLEQLLRLPAAGAGASASSMGFFAGAVEVAAGAGAAKSGLAVF